MFQQHSNKITTQQQKIITIINNIEINNYEDHSIKIHLKKMIELINLNNNKKDILKLIYDIYFNRLMIQKKFNNNPIKTHN